MLSATIKVTSRELARSVLQRSGANWTLMSLRRSRGQDVSHLGLKRSRSDVFNDIYERGIWQNGTGVGALSGLGSQLQNTNRLRQMLGIIIRGLEIDSIVDVGCGDYTWMQHVELGPVSYFGLDINARIVASNQDRFGDSKHSFRCEDAVSTALPPADLVICRDVLFHLSFDDGLRLLRNIAGSAARWIALTTDASTLINSDIATGDYRVLNLSARPFRLPPADVLIGDDAVIARRGFGIWQADRVTRALGIPPK